MYSFALIIKVNHTETAKNKTMHSTKESDEVDASRKRCFGHIPLGRDPGANPELTGELVCLAWEHLRVPQKELESLCGERDVC